MNKLLNRLFFVCLSPYRIVVLHQIANLDPSGCAGSIPAVGVENSESFNLFLRENKNYIRTSG